MTGNACQKYKWVFHKNHTAVKVIVLISKTKFFWKVPNSLCRIGMRRATKPWLGGWRTCHPYPSETFNSSLVWSETSGTRQSLLSNVTALRHSELWWLAAKNPPGSGLPLLTAPDLGWCYDLMRRFQFTASIAVQFGRTPPQSQS